jgi:transcriptional regulator with XRE-family HTH domain
MTRADLERATGLPHATVYAYANGTIRATRRSQDVDEKLKAIAKALDLPFQMLVTAAGLGVPTEVDEETELLRMFRTLNKTEQQRVLFVVREIIAIGRRNR